MQAKSNLYIPGRTMLTAFILLVISSNSCGIFDECDGTLMPLYYVDIRAEITVRDPGYNMLPQVPVRVEMQKTHCGGKPGPNLVSEGETASNGIYTSAGSWSFKMSNSEDFITIRVESSLQKNSDRLTYSQLESYSGTTFLFTQTITTY